MTSAPSGRLTPGDVRAQFPAVSRYCYLDVASRAPMANRVAEALQRYIMTYQTESVPKQQWLQRVEDIRGRTARLMGARPEEVAFTKSTSDSINMLAHGLGLQPGDNVVICPALEHANNVYPWLHMRDQGIEVRTVSPERGRFPIDRAAELFDDRTRITSVSAVSFVTGARADLATLAELCHARGVFLLVDAVQELGAMRMDVRALGIDGLAAATQKMLLGMYGLGILYCSARWLPRMRPPFLTRMGVDWAGGHESDLDMDGYRLSAGAARFEVGNPNFAGLFAFDAALSLLEDVGPETIESHILALAAGVMEGLDRLGIEVVTPREPGQHAGIVSFRHPDASALDTLLRRERVKVAVRRGLVRASVHVFNEAEDVDAFVDVLRHVGAERPIPSIQPHVRSSSP